jgi:cyclic pyranopterin phosphate synthase
MVDITDKAVSARAAVAECRVRFPADVAATLRKAGMATKKGAVLDTAIVAGTMAVKRTLRIECGVRTTHRTGVEMEALTGATVAALTVYDMCKALSHAIVLGPARLLGKRGGGHDFGRAD